MTSTTKLRLTHAFAQSLVQAPLNLEGGENLVTSTGAKLYYLGGGWWRIAGYAWDGGDVRRTGFNFNKLKLKGKS